MQESSPERSTESSRTAVTTDGSVTEGGVWVAEVRAGLEDGVAVVLEGLLLLLLLLSSLSFLLLSLLLPLLLLLMAFIPLAKASFSALAALLFH